MGKNIIICSDGTGNTTIKGRGTNVFRLYESLDLSSHLTKSQNTQQIAFYDDGVGTQRSLPLKLLGAAFGYGLKRNVRQLYTELVRCYEDGDHIYLFGFSRGAYTVRTLARLILKCGIIDRRLLISANDDAARKRQIIDEKQLKKKVKQAYSAFRSHNITVFSFLLRTESNRKKQREKAGKFRQRYSHVPQGDIPIKFVGVWDTVAAVGFPIQEVADLWDFFIWAFKFRDSHVPKNVQHAYQAIALDEERSSFRPMVWDETQVNRGEDFTCEQVWFPGVHTNIGGGYKQPGISLVTLDWMMTKAENHGLRFIDAKRLMYKEQRNHADRMYDSRTGIATLYRYKPRDIENGYENLFTQLGRLLDRVGGTLKKDAHLMMTEESVSGKSTPGEAGELTAEETEDNAFGKEESTLDEEESTPERRKSTFSRGDNLPTRIHSSVLDRILGETAGYAPINLPENVEIAYTEEHPRVDLDQEREALLAHMRARVRPEAGGRLLDKVSRHVNTRKRGHFWLFLLCSASGAAVAAALTRGLLDSMRVPIGAIFLLAVGILMLVTWRAKTEIRRQASEHWTRIRYPAVNAKTDKSAQNGVPEQARVAP
ncbi:MAG: DUF2235 domain-containing protein [Bacteroidota bacterium]